jgi:hypothetical protein
MTRPQPRLVQRACLLALAVVVVFENTEETEIRLVLPKVQMLWVAMAVTTVIGWSSDSCWPAAVMLMPSGDGLQGFDA